MAYVIRDATGFATATDLATVDTVVDAILVDTNAILVDTGTTVPAQITALPQEPSYNNSRRITVTATFSQAAWNTTASHEVFTVTGLVRLRMWIECTLALDSAAHGATVQFGVEGATGGLIAATNETDLVNGDLWYDATPTTSYDLSSNVIMD